jgi:predicted RNA-binding Zn-ribbon protein involved in translation (DUF1610 family)
MNCPECGEKKIIIVHTDKIPCNDCNSIVKIDYCACSSALCNYTFRTNNGEYMDGSFVDYEMTEEIFEELIAAIDAEAIDTTVSVLHDTKMSDMIHNCIRCGEASYRHNKSSYACPACGFEWEILDHE